MKFSAMPYKRPDVAALKTAVIEKTAALRAASSSEEVFALFAGVEEIRSGYGTMDSLATIRHDIDTRDEFYDGEVEFFSQAGPELEEPLQDWLKALLSSAFRPELERKFGSVMFLNAELELKTFSPEIIPELQRENLLTQEYRKLIASAQIPFEGGVYTISQLAPFKLDPDDTRRATAWRAEAGFYKENEKKLDEIYAELTGLRDSMGRKLGYGGFTELGYYRMTRSCYGKGEVESFREAVIKHLVPVADRIYRRQAKRLGKSYPMGFADNALEFRSGNPKPSGTAEDILAHGRAFYHELSPETAGFIDFMTENELMDVLSRDGKSGGGYCTSIFDYKSPFIFANFNGTSGDVEVITHEAGHAFAAYLNRDRIMDCVWPGTEACEVHSMSMEFFAWPWLEGFFGADTRKFMYSHLSGALTFIPYGTMVDHFQHLVYEQPELTPEGRHELWRELMAKYMPWVQREEELPFYGEGHGWQRQAHIYEVPFYYIDYCLAQTVALQFWALIQKDAAAAWETYMKYTAPGGTMTFTELVETAGLLSPFGDDCLRSVCAAADRWLDEFDMSGLE